MSEGWRLCRYAEECSLVDLPDDIRECCEVLREQELDLATVSSFFDRDPHQIRAATWQLLDYLGVLSNDTTPNDPSTPSRFGVL